MLVYDSWNVCLTLRAGIWLVKMIKGAGQTGGPADYIDLSAGEQLVDQLKV